MSTQLDYGQIGTAITALRDGGDNTDLRTADLLEALLSMHNDTAIDLELLPQVDALARSITPTDFGCCTAGSTAHNPGVDVVSTATAERHDVEWDLVEDLNFEPPCDIIKFKGRARGTCEQPAVWVMELRSHCPSSPLQLRLICQDHYQYVIDGGTAFCSGCRTVVAFSDFVVRLERIKP